MKRVKNNNRNLEKRRQDLYLVRQCAYVNGREAVLLLVCINFQFIYTNKEFSKKKYVCVYEIQ